MKRVLLFIFLFLSYSGIAQHQDKVDFNRAEVAIELIPLEQKIKGLVSYEFEVLQDVDSVFLNAKNISVDFINIDGDSSKHYNNDTIISVRKDFKKGKKHVLQIGYSAIPKQTVYFLGWEDQISGNEQIWTQGQGKYTSHWLPSFDDMEEKVEYDMLIVAPNGMEVIANGKKGTSSKLNDKTTWVFDMQKPMSSYLLAFAVGDYKKQVLTAASGIQIENYYYPRDSLKVEPTYRHTLEIFDFLEEEIGRPYPWQNYKQLPVRDFLYAGMENTSATIFSDSYVVDSTAFVDKNYVNVNAHELAHQWFGNLVTEKDGNYHWLHEGFATYYAYLAEQSLFGDDHFYWKLYETLQQLKVAFEKGEGQSLLDPKASSLTFYEKGAWALFMLRNEVGDKAFKKGVRNYLKKFQFKNATVNDLLKEMERASRKNLEGFRQAWLVATELPYENAKKQLAEKSSSIQLLVDMETDLQASQSDAIDYTTYWESTNSIHLKKHLLKNYQSSLTEEIYVKAFESDTIPIRQALFSGRDLPQFLDQQKLESLLEDTSYVTQENALFSLWQSYPEDRIKYLDATKDVIGLPNKNVRLLWLTLAMLSENYNGRKTKDYFDEMSAYTGPEYSFEIRESSFFYLKEAFGLNEESLTNLVKATDHHAWQFKKFARNLLNELLDDSDYKARLEILAKKLNPKESRYLSNKLKTK